MPFDVGDTAGAGDDDVFAPNGWLASRVGQQQQARQQQDEVDRQSGEVDPWIFRSEIGRRLSQAFRVGPTRAEMEAAAERMQQAQAAAQASMGAGPAAAWSEPSGRVLSPGRAG